MHDMNLEKNRSKIDRNGDGVIQFAMLEGESGHQDTLIRSEWVLKELENKKIPTQQIAGSTGNWEKNQANVIVRQWMREYPNQIEVIISNNDDMALGVYDYYKQHNLKLPLILGINNSPEMNQKIQAGEIYGTVDNGTNDQISYICKLLNDILNKNTAKYHKIWYSKPFAIEK